MPIYPRFNPTLILAAVGRTFGVPGDALAYGRRTRHRTIARQLAAYLLHQTGVLSWADVARILRYKHHTNPRDAARRLRQRMHTDPAFAGMVRALESELSLPSARPRPAEPAPQTDLLAPTPSERT